MSILKQQEDLKVILLTFDLIAKEKKGGKSAIRGGGLMAKVMKIFHFFGSLPQNNWTDEESTNLSKKRK